jgi:DNA-binding protein HU-beta
MNKETFVGFLASEFAITKKEAEKAINTFTEGVIKAVGRGESVNLVGFGSFYSIDIKAREGINPKTREKMQIQAYKQPGFKAGQKLKDAANGNLVN